jgi:hypothetical protein
MSVYVSWGGILIIFFEFDIGKYLNLFGGPYWNRTNNLLIKSQVLCLVELTAHIKKNEYQVKKKLSIFFMIYSG